MKLRFIFFKNPSKPADFQPISAKPSENDGAAKRRFTFANLFIVVSEKWVVDSFKLTAPKNYPLFTNHYPLFFKNDVEKTLFDGRRGRPHVLFAFRTS